MKLTKRENRIWWIVVLGIMTSFALLKIIDPEWLGRLIGLGVLYILACLLFFWLALNKNIFKRVNEKKFKSKESAEQARKIFNISGRIFAGAFLAGIVVFLILPYIKSVIYIANGNELDSRDVVVTNRSSSVVPFGTYLFQTLHFDNNKSDSFSLSLHSPLKTGESYEIFYVPTTNLILEVR
jgi:uncharacterized membrane protein YfcA